MLSTKQLILGLAFTVAITGSFTAISAACTYGEALIAFENNNIVRGETLMKMAAADGDQRAKVFLVSYHEKMHKPAANDINHVLALKSE